MKRTLHSFFALCLISHCLAQSDFFSPIFQDGNTDLAQPPAGPEKVKCCLEWIPSRDGHSPEENIVAYNSDEIVARITISGSQIVGRLSPAEGLAFASQPGDVEVHSSSEYYVLTNPRGCELQWEESSNGNLPQYFVENGEFGIGRSYFEDEDGNFNSIGGAVAKNEGLFVSLRGKQQTSKDCEVLTSTYPLLEGYLYNITFPNLEQFVADATQIVESETILKTGYNFDLSQDVMHTGEVEEIFKFSDNLQWKGIGSISLAFDSMLGSFRENFEIQDSNSFNLFVKRAVTLNFKRNVNFSTENFGRIQICSGAKLMTEGRIPFVAYGRFSLTNIPTETVKSILEDSGRNVVELNGREVIAKIEGALSGKFVLEKFTVASAVQKSISCYLLIQESKP